MKPLTPEERKRERKRQMENYSVPSATGSGDEIIGWYEAEFNDGPHLRPMTRAFWDFMHAQKWTRHADWLTPQEKAELVGRYLAWMEEAERASEAGNPPALKQISDAIRTHFGEIPAARPVWRLPRS